MIRINEVSRELTKVEKYLMTASPDIKGISKEVEDDVSIDVEAWCIFTDIKDDEDEVEILSILTPEKECFSCQSATFKRSFKDIVSVMDGEPFSIIKKSGITNAGRDFINCVLDVSKIK